MPGEAPAKRTKIDGGAADTKAQVRDPLAALARSGVVIVDGGLATHLESLGEDIDHALWSARCLVSNPDAIRKAHADYYAAGAHIAITASYQAHLDGFRELGVEEKDALEAMRRSVALAREAAPKGGLVAGSVGSYGASLHNGAEYSGVFPNMDEAKLISWHRPRALALIEAGCDILACETVPSLLEARALATLMDELSFPAWVTFSCRSGTEVSSGETLASCVDALAGCPHVVAVGINCTNPNYVTSLVTICRERLPEGRHVVVYPNSGEEWDGHSHEWAQGTATPDQEFVSLARQWRAAGATCIGGCCRTTPATIRALRDAFAPTSVGGH